MSPTHSQRVNIMSEVLWFRTLRMYFIPLFPTTKAWEVHQENPCAFSSCFFSVTSVIDHWQGFSAEPGGILFRVSLQVSCTQRELASLVTHQEFPTLQPHQEIGFKEQAMFPCTSKPPTFGLKFWFHSAAGIHTMDWDQLSKLS